jgi:hypothetical protein
MAIPRAAILLSLATAALLIISTIVVGYSVYDFAKNNEDAFSVTDKDLLKDENERWYWEIDLLFIPATHVLESGTGQMCLLTKMMYFSIQENCVVIGSIRAMGTEPAL